VGGWSRQRPARRATIVARAVDGRGASWRLREAAQIRDARHDQRSQSARSPRVLKKSQTNEAVRVSRETAMQNQTVVQPTTTYILLVADFFAEGIERDPTSVARASDRTPSPWSPPAPRARR